MNRQRITVFNAGETHDSVIKHVGPKNIHLESADPFLVEVKTTSPHIETPNLIESIRISYSNSKQLPSNKYPPLFQYFFQNGWSVYFTISSTTTNSGANKELFFEQAGQVLEKYFDLPPETSELGIQATSSIYYSFLELGDPKDVLERISGQKLDTGINALDIVISSSGNTVLKFVYETNSVEIERSDFVYQEVGLFLLEEQLTARDDIVLSGIRVVYDPEDQIPPDNDLSSIMFKTLFHVKPRHRLIDTINYETSVKPNGLHPILVTNFNHNVSRIYDEDIGDCETFYYLNLEKSFFIDKYQLPDNQVNVLDGVLELELPAYKVKTWGTEVLLQLKDPNFGAIELQLHSRYQKPKENDPQTTVSINQPIIFQACSIGKVDSNAVGSSPFDNHINKFGGNYEAFFTPDSVFYHYNGSVEPISIDIPNGSSDLHSINWKTSIVVLLGLILVLNKLIKMFIMKYQASHESKKND